MPQPLPKAAVPSAFGPIRLLTTDTLSPLIVMPVELPEITLRSAAPVPPITTLLLNPPTRTPLALPRSKVPALLVPMKLPRIAAASASRRLMPPSRKVLPEITLRSA